MISDMLGSVGAILAAILIIFFGWSWADPAASVIVAILVLRSGYHVTKDSIHVLMEGTRKISMSLTSFIQLKRQKEFKAFMVCIWSITSGLNALSATLLLTIN